MFFPKQKLSVKITHINGVQINLQKYDIVSIKYYRELSMHVCDVMQNAGSISTNDMVTQFPCV